LAGSCLLVEERQQPNPDARATGLSYRQSHPRQTASGVRYGIAVFLQHPLHRQLNVWLKYKTMLLKISFSSLVGQNGCA
jgi:hypothetical protein